MKYQVSCRRKKLMQQSRVLRAMLGCLPGRGISLLPMRSMVFASNKTLSQRLNGMPESTLRRHISQLVAAGIVSRHDSANRKRFSRHLGQGEKIAFGFDLAALAQNMRRILDAAKAAHEARERMQGLRAKLAILRKEMIETHGETALISEASKLMRRKATETQLNEMIKRLAAQLEPEAHEPCTAKLSASNSQNERHIDPSKKSHNNDDDLLDVVDACTEYQLYDLPKPTTWKQVIDLSTQIAPLLGISQGTLSNGFQRLGTKHCSVLILWMLERASQINHPVKYFTTICQEGLRVDLAFRGGNCQLTT